MPNWCDNYLKVHNDDPKKVDELLEAFKKNSLLNHLTPIGEWKYDRAVDAWGTKWEPECYDFESQVDRINPQEAVLSFQTAYSPPLQAYTMLGEQDFEYTAHWFEPGCLVAGSSYDGDVDDYEIEELNEQLLEELPTEFLDVFGESLSNLISEISEDEEE